MRPPPRPAVKVGSRRGAVASGHGEEEEVATDGGRRDQQASCAGQVTPRPELRRQLEGRDLLVFWRDGSAPGQRSGLALTLDSCRSVDCECRAVKLDGLVVRDDVALIECTGDELCVSEWAGSAPAEPKRKILVEVDIETGDVEPLHEEYDPDLLAWVTAEVDGELLDRLHERWRIGKGWPGRSRISRQLDLRGWAPGALLGFDEVFEAERHDRLVIGDAMYWVDTYLCPVPNCGSCGNADVVFSTVSTKEAGDVGSVQLALRLGAAEVVSQRPEPGQEAQLLELWERFSRRHVVGQYLARRQARMQMAWPALERALPTTAAVRTSLRSAAVH